MARKSGWQQFADNFNSVYDTFNTVGRNVETNRLMDEELIDPSTGAAYTDPAMADRARSRALADIYSKYGDAAGGLQLRQSVAALEAADRDNELNRQIFQNQVSIQGQIAEQLARANVGNVQSQTGLNNTRAGDINATQPYRLDGLRLGNLNSELQYNLGTATFDSDVETARANATLAGSNAAVGEGTVDARVNTANATAGVAQDDATVSGQTVDARVNTANATAGVAQDDAAVSAQTVDARVNKANADAGLAQNNETLTGLEAATAQTAANNADLESSILMQVNDPQYRADNNIESPEDAQAAFLKLVRGSNIPIDRQAVITQTVNSIGLAPLQQRAAELTLEADNAMRTGGLDGLVSFYDTVDDGPDTETPSQLQVVREGDTVSVISQVGAQTRTLYTNTGPNAEAVVSDYMINTIKNPGAAMTIAADAIALEQARANVDNTLAQTTLRDEQSYTEILNQDNVQARTDYAQAQVRKIEDDIAARGGLGDRETLMIRGYQQFLGSADYLYMLEQNPEQAAEVAAQVQVMMYKPPSMDMDVWLNMLPQDRLLFMPNQN